MRRNRCMCGVFETLAGMHGVSVALQTDLCWTWVWETLPNSPSVKTAGMGEIVQGIAGRTMMDM